jgi:hypothetical protein
VLSLAQDPRTIVNALAASKALRRAAVQLIDCIVVRKVVPPAHIWESFPRATRVRIHRYHHGNPHLGLLRAILATLPARVTAIEDMNDEHIAWSFPGHGASLRFAQALVASACCSNLLSVKLSSGLPAHACKLTPAAADIILQGLPRLQEARLSIDASQASASGQQQQVWSPKAQSCQDLAHLDLSCTFARWFAGRFSIDLSGLSSATKLQRISVDQVAATNLAALQALTNLQHLGLGHTDCPAASWAVLAKLPNLGSLQLSTLEISPSAPAAVVTCLHLGEGPSLLHDEAQLPGCLARQLPLLQHLQLDADFLTWWMGPQNADTCLAAALQGHQQLKDLHANGITLSAAAWVLLAVLPGLVTVEVRKMHIDATSPGAAALISLRCSELFLGHTGQQLRGCLSRQLPQLQRLSACLAHVPALAAALDGHQKLQKVYAEGHYQAGGPDAGWGHDVLAELASCSSLQELELGCTDELVTAAGCAALAAGACRESLRVVRLRASVVPPALLAPLFQPSVAAMQEVVLGLPEGFDRSAVQQQVQQVLPAGGGWQWEIYSQSRSYEMRWLCTLSREVAVPGAAGASSR